MRWFESPYFQAGLTLLLIFLFLVTAQSVFLLLALPMMIGVVYAIAQQPELLRKPRAALWNGRAARYAKRNNLAAAVDLYTRAIERAPEFADAYLNRALASVEQGNFDAAFADAESAIRLSQDTADAYVVRGRVRTAWGNDAVALGDWERAERLGSRLVFSVRGIYHLERRQFVEAVRDLDRATRYNTRNPSLTAAYAFALAATGDLDTALKLNQRAHKLDHRLAWIYLSRGHTYFLRRDYENALTDFQKAGELARDEPFALAGQAVTYHAMGQTREAVYIWKLLPGSAVASLTAAPAFIDELNRLEKAAS